MKLRLLGFGPSTPLDYYSSAYRAISSPAHRCSEDGLYFFLRVERT
jgi:hypothetical protein